MAHDPKCLQVPGDNRHISSWPQHIKEESSGCQCTWGYGHKQRKLGEVALNLALGGGMDSSKPLGLLLLSKSRQRGPLQNRRVVP